MLTVAIYAIVEAMRLNKDRSSAGFALPTVIVASVVAMMLLLVAASASTAIREGLYAQHYRRLAREAAESGVVLASKCLELNNDLAQWSDASKLRPNTDCKGAVVAGRTQYVQQDGNVRTTFEVSEPERREGSIQRITAVGRTELIRTTDGAVWKSYEYRLAGQAGLSALLDSVSFGYAAGGGFTLNGAFFTVIDEFGRPRSAGFNGFGQLGVGSTTDTLTLKQFNIPANKRVVRTYTNFLSHGRNVFALTENGEVWGAGLHNFGQIGNPSQIIAWVTNPVQFILPGNDNVATFVSPLGIVTFVVTAKGNVYVAGSNEKGVAGINSTAPTIKTPTKMPFPEKIRADAHSWAVDSKTAYAIGESGAVYGWGNNEFGQLAQGDINERRAPVRLSDFGKPGKTKAVQLAFDGDTVYIRDSAGAVYSAGKTNYGQAGVPTFRLRAGVSDRCLAAVGANLRTEKCSGAAANQKWHFDRTNNALQVESNPGGGQNRCVEATGHNNEETRMRWCAWWSGGKRFDFRYPAGAWSHVYLSNSTDIGGRGLCVAEVNIATGGETRMNSCEYYADRTFLPYNPTLERVAPSGVVDITTDQYFTTMVYANGEVKTFGLNNGALGNGVYVDTSNLDAYKRHVYNPTPVKFILPPGAKAVSSWTTSNGLNPKNANTFVVTSDGRVFGAGSNVTGQLGIGHIGGGTNGIYPTPQQMLVLGTQGNLASYVRSGYGTTVVYTNNRKVFTVGNNSNGQLGDDTTTTNPTPRANKNTNAQRHVKFY